MFVGSSMLERRVPILVATKRWSCPSCGLETVTQEAKPHVPMHPCPKMGGLVASFSEVDAKQKTRHVMVEREDYVNNETVTTVDGRPIMALRTEREDGSADVSVFAPLANLKGEVF